MHCEQQTSSSAQRDTNKRHKVQKTWIGRKQL